MTVVLALDLATTTGWARGKAARTTVPEFGHTRFAKQGEPRAAAYRTFRLWLDLMMSAHKIDLIVYETPIPAAWVHGKTNISTTKLLTGFAEHLEEWAYDRFELREASVGQVRAHFLGQNMKSALAKPMTVNRCRQLGWDVETTDEADACALWDYQRQFLSDNLLPLFGETP